MNPRKILQKMQMKMILKILRSLKRHMNMKEPMIKEMTTVQEMMVPMDMKTTTTKVNEIKL
jgi:hypothetical protein